VKTALPTHRALCERCLRPTSVCVCAHLPRLAPRTKVLSRSTLVVGVDLDGRETVRRALADPAAPPILLWPGPGARDLARDPPAGPVTLVAVDGTWHLAKKLLKLNPGLAALPRYAIAPEQPSGYRIRREPSAECLSTIEALAQALGCLEGDRQAYRAMLKPFHAMVETQIEQHRRARTPRTKERLRLRRRLPWSLPAQLADPARVVVATVETNAYPLDAADRHPDEIVAWFAVRADGSEASQLVVRPSHPPAPSVVAHTGIPLERLLAGAERAALRRAVDASLQPGDVLATWGSYTTRMLREEGLLEGRTVVDLRRVASMWLRSAPGSIERCAEQVGGTPAVLGLGRGGRRLGLELHVLRALRGPRPD
jgi:DTW domain-containing protein